MSENHQTSYVRKSSNTHICGSHKLYHRCAYLVFQLTSEKTNNAQLTPNMGKHSAKREPGTVPPRDLGPQSRAFLGAEKQVSGICFFFLVGSDATCEVHCLAFYAVTYRIEWQKCRLNNVPRHFCPILQAFWVIVAGANFIKIHSNRLSFTVFYGMPILVVFQALSPQSPGLCGHHLGPVPLKCWQT